MHDDGHEEKAKSPRNPIYSITKQLILMMIITTTVAVGKMLADEGQSVTGLGGLWWRPSASLFKGGNDDIT